MKTWLADTGFQEWSQMTSDYNEFKRHTIQSVSELRAAGGQAQGGSWGSRGRGVLESKVWAGVHTIGMDSKVPYKEWHAKFKNAYFQARPGGRSQDMWAWMEAKSKEIVRGARTGAEIPKA